MREEERERRDEKRRDEKRREEKREREQEGEEEEATAADEDRTDLSFGEREREQQREQHSSSSPLDDEDEKTTARRGEPTAASEKREMKGGGGSHLFILKEKSINQKNHSKQEYKLVNRNMTLGEFKSIYWMEWAHRMWGRALGLAFVLPGSYFLFAKRTITPRLAKRLALLLAAGGGQGLVGWWMVRSGLTEPTERSGLKEPRVAPTRLAAHLASATAIYCTLVYTSLQLAFPIARAALYAKNAEAIAALRKARMIAHPLAGVIAVTALSGAFVAGLDAGRAFNTFPKMNGEWIPEEYPGLSGAFSDTAAAQLHHRVLAATTFVATFAAWAAGRNPGALPRTAAVALAALPAAATLQASLGVATLLTYVPAGLGSAHQAGALGLLTLALGLIFATRRPPRVLASATKRALSEVRGPPVASAGAVAAAATAATA